jgi:IMP cyclohydrolase
LTDRCFFVVQPPPPGLGYGLTTYASDGSPLPPFRGDPLWLPLDGTAGEVADTYWAALDAENKVALAVKAVPAAGGASALTVRNRFG